jgi:hypothetical protein
MEVQTYAHHNKLCPISWLEKHVTMWPVFSVQSGLNYICCRDVLLNDAYLSIIW